jgi:hypothetical protein
MVEALVLFESVVNSVWFAKSSIILFLNKADVLAQKIQDPDQQVSQKADQNGAQAAISAEVADSRSS